jgi:hypothetical protein
MWGSKVPVLFDEESAGRCFVEYVDDFGRTAENVYIVRAQNSQSSLLLPVPVNNE